VVIFDYGNERISFTDRRLFSLLEGGDEGSELSIYSANQAIGEPDAVNRASYANAWFPSDEHGKHWLELTYAAPTRPVRVEIWGTNSQRGLTAIHATTESGSKIVVDWVGEVQKTLEDGLALTSASVEVGEPVVKIRLDIDCSRVDGANVVDAVGLVDAAGTTHWAREARADGSLHSVDRPEFVARAALERHAARLQKRGQTREAASVRRRIEALN